MHQFICQLRCRAYLSRQYKPINASYKGPFTPSRTTVEIRVGEDRKNSTNVPCSRLTVFAPKRLAWPGVLLFHYASLYRFTFFLRRRNVCVPFNFSSSSQRCQSWSHMRRLCLLAKPIIEMHHKCTKTWIAQVEIDATALYSLFTW